MKKEERAYVTCTVAHEAKEIAHNTYEIVLEKPTHDFTFLPGQSMKFVFEDIVREDGSPRHPSFTIVSAPHETHLRFVFRGSESPLKTNLLNLKKGDTVTMRDVLRQTVDRAVYPETDAPVVMFACGVGIAPFMSIASHAKHIGDARKFILYYANPTEKDVVYKEQIDTLVNDPSLNISCWYHLTKEERAGYAFGYFSDEDIVRALKEAGGTPLVYVSGPPMMVEGLEQKLIEECRLSEEQVRTKKYTGYEGEDDTLSE